MRKLTTNEFINKSNLTHKNKFDYSYVDYKNNCKKVKIICPIHKGFFQKPQNHLAGKGCKKCANYNLHEKRKFTTEQFIKKSKKIHGNKYDYSKSIHKNISTKLIIICSIHGFFKQSPYVHWSGCGCPKCGMISIGNKNRSNLNDFIKLANKVHKNKFDYSKSSYNGAHVKTNIICKKHGIFNQTPTNHLSGKECPKCNKNISKSEVEFLEHMKIKYRHVSLSEWKQKTVDGYNKKTNTVYEFLGDYWHGNPKKYNPNQYNKTCKKTYKELYENTFNVLNKIKSLGYNVMYIWESDWENFKKGIILIPNIQSL